MASTTISRGNRYPHFPASPLRSAFRVWLAGRDRAEPQVRAG